MSDEPPNDISNGEHPILRLANGRLVYPGGRVVDPARPQPGETMSFADVVQSPQIQSTPPPQRTIIEGSMLRPATRRHLHEIPDTVRNANACALVAAYTLYGLTDEDIATALNTSGLTIVSIRDTEVYHIIHDALCQTVLDAETDQVRDIFRQHAKTAANVLVDTLHNGNRAERVSAAKDFLDRAGHRPVDIIEHRHRMEGGLIIEVVKRNNIEHLPSFDMETVDDNS